MVRGTSQGGTTAKIMHFSSDVQFSLENDDIASIEVFEEMSPSANRLEYGIASGACTVKIKDKYGRFTKYSDLMKKNRIVKPFVYAVDLESRLPQRDYPLGTFYSDEWAISADSRYITCKAYDSLYLLQNIVIEYPRTAITENGQTSWYVDGKASKGSTTRAIPSTFGEVVKKVVGLANIERREKGLFGDDIAIVVDPALNGMEIDCVLLGKDTAWNMLKKLAIFARAYIYTDREGKIHAAKAGSAAGTSPAKITPDNSFTYNLPDYNKTVINKVNVDYTEITDGKEDDDKFTIALSDCEEVKNGQGTVTHYIATLKLKNFYNSFSKEMVKRYVDDVCTIEWNPSLNIEIID